MVLNIIHLGHRIDRLHLLKKQLFEQNIQEYKLWEGIITPENPKIGIAKAHKRIVEFAKYQNLPSILIAEDDVRFTTPKAFDFYLKNEPNEYDLYLGGIMYGKINSDNSVDDFAGTHFYKIKQNFYETFLSIPEGKDIDRSLSNKGKFFVCNPFVAVQHNGFSDNHKKYQDYDSYLGTCRVFNK